MAETARCTKCELVHDRTPDWHCPRCGSEVDLVGVKRLRAADQFPTGGLVAGGVSIAAGLLAFAALRGESWQGTLASLLTTALGVALLARRRWARVVGILSTVAGFMLVMTAALLSYGNVVEHLLAAVTCGGFLLLLRGKPGTLTIAGGVALCTPALLAGMFFAVHGWGAP